MNRTFFGDTRDLFKYDLVRHVMKALGSFDSFTFIPMLSEDAEKSGGKGATRDLEKAARAGKAGSQNRDLLTHMYRLQEIESDLEYFQMIHAYFKKENILVDILHKKPFSHKNRSDYFESVLSRFPKKSLIFLDPDIGLEEAKPSKKHLLFDEVEKIFSRMDARSVLMIYQHFPREKHEGYVRRRCAELYQLTGAHPITITDNEVIFFFLAREGRLYDQLEEVLARYADTYPLLESSGCP
ncbi:MAG: hypothetical protein GYA23_07855 [Methanomicrobiales archaeon]|nr:hypothetical protein [Methanomicrobiales archaeon]